jgi:predicted MFS family arabinose efflux permease
VFFSIGSTIATSLVPKEKAASAIAIMFGGLTVALVTGVPIGTFIGQHFGWRETFLAVSILGVIALVSSLILVPNNIPGRASASLRDQLKSHPSAPADDLCHYRIGIWRRLHRVYFPGADDAGAGRI